MARAAFIARLGIPRDPKLKGTTFGFGVRGYPVVSEPELAMHFFHAAPDHAGRLEQRYVCTECNAVVDDRTKGVEVDGVVVTFTKDELETLEPKVPGKEIGIRHTISLDTIDPLWYDTKSYYLVPEHLGDSRAYSNLLQALQREKLVAVVTFVYYAKYRTGVVIPTKHGL